MLLQDAYPIAQYADPWYQFHPLSADGSVNRVADPSTHLGRSTHLRSVNALRSVNRAAGPSTDLSRSTRLGSVNGPRSVNRLAGPSTHFAALTDPRLGQRAYLR